MWLTNHRPSVLWHCWLGHVTRKTVSEMTYNVSSGTLNSTMPYHTSHSPCLSYCWLMFRHRVNCNGQHLTGYLQALFLSTKYRFSFALYRCCPLYWRPLYTRIWYRRVKWPRSLSSSSSSRCSLYKLIHHVRVSTIYNTFQCIRHDTAITSSEIKWWKCRSTYDRVA